MPKVIHPPMEQRGGSENGRGFQPQMGGRYDTRARGFFFVKGNGATKVKPGGILQWPFQRALHIEQAIG